MHTCGNLKKTFVSGPWVAFISEQPLNFLFFFFCRILIVPHVVSKEQPLKSCPKSNGSQNTGNHKNDLHFWLL